MEIKKRRRVLVGAVAGAVVLGGAAFALPVLAQTGGTIAGHLTDAGAPVSNAYVTVWDTAYNYVTSTSTAPDGGFQFSGLIAGGYKVQFNASGFEQWSVQKSDFDQADVITVADGATAAVEEVVRPTGSISGVVTNTDGTPASFIQVSAAAISGAGYGYAYTDAAGAYTLSRLLPGDYRVIFNFGNLPQYANNATRYDQATPITVTVGSTATLNQQRLPAAEVSGTVLTASGGPAAYVSVSFNSNEGSGYGSATTDGSGHYAVSLWPGTYSATVRQGNLEQYVPGKRTYLEAGHYTFGVGSHTLDETLLPTGTISGTLTRSDGAPVSWAQVTATGGGIYSSVSTDGSGFYSLPAFEGGGYKLEFATIYGTQYAHGKSTRTLADPISVTGGQTTTVNEVLAPFGSVTVTAVDSVTHEAVQEFCVDGLGEYACTITGSITVNEALPGVHTFSVHPDWGTQSSYLDASAKVTVVSGAVTPVAVTLARGGTVTLTMTDHTTGLPVADACLVLVDAQLPGTFSYGDPQGERCSGPDGVATATLVRPGTYKALVWARDGVHGHQWVGQSGGVGEWDKAKTITVIAGGTTTLLPARLDGRGVLAGTVTDELTGQPLQGAAVTLTPFTTDRSGGDALGVAYTDAQGHYSYADLGPYQWSVFYSDQNYDNTYAGEWTGDEADRDRAGHVKVKKDQTISYDVQLGKGATLTGRVIDGGEVVDSAIVYAYDAQTGAVLAERELWIGGGTPTFVLQVKGPQQVKFAVALFSPYSTVWVGGTSFADAQVVNVPIGGVVSVDLSV